jgi:hypothetical protein
LRSGLFLYIRLMSDRTIYHLGIVIDHLTNSIRDTITGENFDTQVLEVTKADLKEVTKKSKWHFNWNAEFKQLDRIIYKLVIIDKPGAIQGLVSVSDMGDHYYLHLAEARQLILEKVNAMKGLVEICLHSIANDHGTMAMRALLHLNQKPN